MITAYDHWKTNAPEPRDSILDDLERTCDVLQADAEFAVEAWGEYLCSPRDQFARAKLIRRLTERGDAAIEEAERAEA